MKHRHQLAGLGNDELLAALSSLVKHDQALTADLLAHLAELDQRQLFAELGFPSLFAYCTEVGSESDRSLRERGGFASGGQSARARPRPPNDA